MKVKIIKCDLPNSWYYNQVGSIVNVFKDLNDPNAKYYYLEGAHNTQILKEDCEVIADTPTTPKIPKFIETAIEEWTIEFFDNNSHKIDLFKYVLFAGTNCKEVDFKIVIDKDYDVLDLLKKVDSIRFVLNLPYKTKHSEFFSYTCKNIKSYEITPDNYAIDFTKSKNALIAKVTFCFDELIYNQDKRY